MQSVRLFLYLLTGQNKYCILVKGAKVTAIVSRSPEKRSGDRRGIKGNFGPEGRKIDLGDIARYETLYQLLKDQDVDLVDICLPQTMHADASTCGMISQPMLDGSVARDALVLCHREVESVRKGKIVKVQQ